MPLSLRIDPWAADYEGALRVELDGEDEERAATDVYVETDNWRPLGPVTAEPEVEAIYFVDGVRRVDVGVIDEGDGRLVYGLFGSYAAGVVRYCRGSINIERRETKRSIVLGADLRSEEIVIEAGTATLRYQPSSADENNRRDVLQRLQMLMRTLEGELARPLAAEGSIAFLDGGLTFLLPLQAPLLGYIKTHSRWYLPSELLPQLNLLETGMRTPVFRFGERAASRYSWYLRLAAPRAIDYSLAGVVRLEVSSTLGLADAVRLADYSAALLPRFASERHWDARAPQNLYPIAALEDRLRHELGDHEWVRRHIETHFQKEGQI